MSVFQVQLTQSPNSQVPGGGPLQPPPYVLTGDGSMDTWAQQNGTSYQRTIYCMGPNRINRKLKDGATFTDCNYWKQFCAAPVGPLTAETAFITLISDDGSVYVSGQPSTFIRT